MIYTHTEVVGAFRKMSLKYISLGATYVKLLGKNEKYAAERPQLSVHNLILGELYLDLFGTQKAVNHSTKEVCEYTCYLWGWNNKDAFKVDGVIRDKEGNEVWDFFGKWNEFFSIRHKQTGEERELWRIDPWHELWDHTYHLTLFGLQLNYIDEQLAKLLPPTDSWFRTD